LSLKKNTSFPDNIIKYEIIRGIMDMSLRNRLILYLGVVLIAAFSVNSLIALSREKALYKKQLIEKATLLASGVAKDLEKITAMGLGLKEIGGLKEKLVATCKDTDVRYAFIADDKGMVISSSDPIIDTEVKSLSIPIKSPSDRKINDKSFIETGIPIGKDTVQGYVITEVPLDIIVAWTKTSTMNSVLMMIVSVFVLGGLVVIIMSNVTKQLLKSVEHIGDTSDKLLLISNTMDQWSHGMAQGASEQAASLEETSSSLEELSSMTRMNAENADQANALASKATASADKGGTAVGRMIETIDITKKSSDETAKIIKVIDEIAFQTNLLALNAAVEAARAGEAGKGFAVVAEEVKNLAQRSADAAKETSKLIEESQKNADDGVKVTEDVAKELSEISDNIKKATGLMNEVAAASQEQAQGVDQINAAVSQADQVTQQNAANAEESAAAGNELSTHAKSLQEFTCQLMTMVEGNHRKVSYKGQYTEERRDFDYTVDSLSEE